MIGCIFIFKIFLKADSMHRLTTFSENLASEGYVFLPQFFPELPLQVAVGMLGRMEVVEGLSLLQMLTPKPVAESTPNTYSGNFGTGEFPLHTDLAHWAIPPCYIVLRCVAGTSSVGTLLLDRQVIVEAVGRERLRMALVQPRRPLRDGKHLLRLLEKHSLNERERIRWDAIFLRPTNSFAAKVIADVKGVLECSSPIQVFLREPGDTLLLDNGRLLHGRSSVLESDAHRVIARAYLGMVR